MSSRALVATRKGLFTLERRPQGWIVDRVSFPGDNVPMALFDARDRSIFAALGHGHFGVKLHRSTDGGSTWREIARTGLSSETRRTPTDQDPVRRTPIDWTLELIWSLEGGGPQRPGRLWAGTVPGGLFRSDDSGESWQLVRSLWDRPERQKWFGGGMDRPGIHSIVVDPRDNDRVSVGISCGGAWHTATAARAGASRARACAPPSCRPTGRRPQHPGRAPPGGLRRPPDPSGSSTTTASSAPPTAAGPGPRSPTSTPPPSASRWPCTRSDPDVAWFVPAIKDEKRIPAEGRLVVTRTRDGGRTFSRCTRGLPQSWAYDLVYRHAFATDHTGDRLILGSTTGNLFISEDAGTTWQTISHHLPPIYATTFHEP